MESSDSTSSTLDFISLSFKCSKSKHRKENKRKKNIVLIVQTINIFKCGCMI